MSTDGALGQFVVAEANAETDAYYDPSTGYVVIGKDVLERGDGGKKSVARAWFAAALHETTHGTKDTVGQMLMAGAMEDLDGGKHYTQMLKDLSNRGYLEGKASDIRARIKRAVEKDAKGQQLSKKEAADMAVFLDEAPSIMAEHVLNNEHFLRRLLAADAGFVEKLLGKIAETKEALSRAGDADAKALHREIVKIEDIFMDSVAEAGMEYREGKLVMVNGGEEEKERRKTNEPYSYDDLITKDDMPITAIDDSITWTPNKTTRESIVERAQKNAIDAGANVNENGNPVIYVADAGMNVILGKNGLRHGLDRRLQINAPVTIKAGEILKNAIRINELNPRKETIEASYVLIGAAKNAKNEPYIVEFVVNRSTNEIVSVDVLYSVNAKTEASKQKESAGSLSPEVTDLPATLTDSTVSIAQLLAFVNRYYPDIMPKDVYEHFGHKERPAGELGRSAKYSRKPKAKKPANEHAFDDAVARMEEREAGADVDAKAAEGEAVTRTNEEKVQVSEEKFKHITPNMTDETRYRILKERKIDSVPETYDIPPQVLEKMSGFSDWSDVDRYFGKDKRGLILKLATEFGAVGKEYSNQDIELEFEFSKNNFRESYNKQGQNYRLFAKMFSVFDKVIDGAVGIEVHKRTDYKNDPTLENMYVLASAFLDGDTIVPVKLEVKKFKDKPASLYVAVSLHPIKMTEVWKQGTTENGVAQNSRSVTISISDLFAKINPKDAKILKYIPDGFLNQEQLDAKIRELNMGDSPKETAQSDRNSIEAKLPEDPEALALRGDQRKALANWSRNKVYSRKDAMEIVDGVVQLIGKIASGNSEYGKDFHVAKVLGRVRERSIDQLFAELNTASTPTEREAVAQKIAEQMIAEARVEVFLSDEEAARAHDTISMLQEYRGSMNLAEVEDEAKKVFGKGRTPLTDWRSKESGRGMTPLEVRAELAENYGILMLPEDPLDIVLWIDKQFSDAMDKLSTTGRYLLKDSLEGAEYDLAVIELAREIVDGFAEKGQKSAKASMQEEHQRQMKAVRDQRDKQIENQKARYAERLEKKEAYFQGKLKKIREEMRMSARFVNLSRDIVRVASDLFLWKNEVFFNHTGISDVDLFRRTLGKLTTERYRGHFNQKGARKCIQAYGEWYLSDETKRILGDGEDWGARGFVAL